MSEERTIESSVNAVSADVYGKMNGHRTLPSREEDKSQKNGFTSSRGQREEPERKGTCERSSGNVGGYTYTYMDKFQRARG